MIRDDTLGAQVIQASVDFSGSGDNLVIPGVSNKIIKVLQYFLVIAGQTTLTFKSASIAITGPLEFSGSSADVQDFIQLPLTCLNAGDGFLINSSAAVQIGGTIWYIAS